MFTDYLTLCKPKVVLLMLITAWVGMYLAGANSFNVVLFSSLGIAFAASSAAVINHLIERHIDKKMYRTARRPIANGRLSAAKAAVFSLILAIFAFILLININLTTTVLSFLSLLGYAIFYTWYLKRATPQNIVIGGAAGAMPPLLGWSAITGTIHPHALLLVLIIFVWTPPHFWALAIYRKEDYINAKLPMLPITHGVKFTKFCILLYTILLFPIALLPFIVGMSHEIYLVASSILNICFMYYSVKLYYTNKNSFALKTFHFSTIYLLFIFLILIFDHKIGSIL